MGPLRKIAAEEGASRRIAVFVDEDEDKFEAAGVEREHETVSR
jgi:hypothetical protein